MAGKASTPAAMAAAVHPAYKARERGIALRMAAAFVACILAASLAGAGLVRVLGWKVCLAAYAVAELWFVRHYHRRAQQLNQQPSPHKPPGCDGAANSAAYMRLSQYFKFSDKYLSPWFLGAPLEAIKRENVLDLLAYGFWYSTMKELRAEGQEHHVTSMLQQLEEETGLHLPPGHNPDLRMMTHLWDDLPHFYRPLAFYLFMEGVAGLTAVMLAAAGFERHTLQGHTYYTLHLGRAAAERPIMFLHGVGAGHFPYITFVAKLAAQDRPLIMPVYPHVSMRMCAAIPSTQQLVDAAAGFLRAVGVPHVDLVSHSYGTLVASRLVRCHREVVTTCTMVDPVCFAMFMPTLLRTFLYSFPSSGNFVMDFAMWAVARELHCAAAFSRGFYWSECNMWSDGVPDDMLVVLSGQDVLCASHQVKDWLQRTTSAQVLYHEDMPHAGFLLNLAYQDEIMGVWQQYAARSSSSTTTSSGSSTQQVTAAAVDAEVIVEATEEEEEESKPLLQAYQQQQKVKAAVSPAAPPAAEPRPAAASSAFSQQAAAKVAATYQQKQPRMAGRQSAPSGGIAAAAQQQQQQELERQASQQQRLNPFLCRQSSFAAASAGISAAPEAAHTWAPPAGVQYSVPVWGTDALSSWVDQGGMQQQQRSWAAAQQLLSLASAVRAVQGLAGAHADISTDDESSGDDSGCDDITTLDQMYRMQAGRNLHRRRAGLRRPVNHGVHGMHSMMGPGMLPSMASTKGALDMAASIDIGALSHLGALQPIPLNAAPDAPWGY